MCWHFQAFSFAGHISIGDARSSCFLTDVKGLNATDISLYWERKHQEKCGCVYLVWIWYVIMTRSGVFWIMLHREFSPRLWKLCWFSAGASWVLRALRDVSDESLLAKYLLLLLLLPVNPLTSQSLCSEVTHTLFIATRCLTSTNISDQKSSTYLLLISIS